MWLEVPYAVHGVFDCVAAGGVCGLALAPGANVRGLCRQFGISQTTAYKWLARYRELGPEGLSDRSRRPRDSPSRTPRELEARVAELRKAHPV